MSLDKSIKSGKEHRKQYRGSKAVDSTCRNHGSCKHCRDNRLHKYLKDEYTDETKLKNPCSCCYEAEATIGGLCQDCYDAEFDTDESLDDLINQM